ncbi:MAG: aminoacyl-tRNA hydrolase [Pseudomonadales bacterium]
MSALRLIVGLGNPSPQYDRTRHNVGAMWVRALASRLGIALQAESKFKGGLGRGVIGGHDLRLLVPSTYMNNSGESVAAVAQFYKITVDEILVAYDEMAFLPGVLRLKTGGGDNGHNGLKSVRSGLGNNGEFHRLRIGVGHPGDKSRVTAYLTQVKMPTSEQTLIEQALALDDALLSRIVQQDWQNAMNVLHADANLTDNQEDS